MVQQFHKFSLLFRPNEQLVGAVLRIGRLSRKLFEQGGVAVLLAPALNALLMGNPKEPTAKLLVISQTAEVPGGVDERLLDNIETGLLLVYQFEYINIQRQLVTLEKSVPSLRHSGSGLRHGQLFAFSHYQHLHPVECARRGKGQAGVYLFAFAPPAIL